MIVNLPYKLLIEESVLDKIEEFFLQMNLGKKCALICDKNVYDLIGKDIEKVLSDKFRTEVIISNSTDSDDMKEISKKLDSFDFTIGIGGGTSIDIAKYSSFLAKKPWIAFPTILSHDGVVSSRASISSNGNKISVDATEPIAIIADLITIKKAPYRWIASGAGDLISNISAIEDWKLAAKAGKEEYHTLMAELSLLSAKGVASHTDEISEMTSHGMEILLWSLICSGFAMNIYGSSRPCSGSEHNFSHVLDLLNSKALHGEQCALGTIIMTYLQGGDWKEIKDTMIKLKLPTNSKEIEIEKELLINALVKARDIRDRYTILNEKEITKEKAEEILEKVGII